MHIVVTGAAGFIGSHVCERLVALGHQVTGIDSFDDYLYSSSIKRANATTLVQHLGEDCFTLVEANICDADRMRAVCGAPSVDVVCHLAALAGVRPSLMDPARYMRTNLEGTTNIFEACREAGKQRIVFASSSSVYGARNADSPMDAVAFREDDDCLTPASPYAMTKRAGELLSSTYCDLFGMGISALRFFTVYGPRQRPDMAIHKFVAAVADGNPITVYGDGESRRDYTYVDDVVSGTIAAILRVQDRGGLNIYNLGGTSTISLSNLVALVEETVGNKAIINRQPMQPGDVPVTFADITHAARDLDYAPKTPITDGLPRFWEWYRSRA